MKSSTDETSANIGGLDIDSSLVNFFMMEFCSFFGVFIFTSSTGYIGHIGSPNRYDRPARRWEDSRGRGLVNAPHR